MCWLNNVHTKAPPRRGGAFVCTGVYLMIYCIYLIIAICCCMNKKSIVIFYFIFIVCSALSVLYIPHALTYPFASEISILILFFPLGYTLWYRFGIHFFLTVVASLSVFALSVEYVGLITGFPYGSFLYTAPLGYRIAGVLPWTVGFSWVPLMIGAVALVYTITTNTFYRIVAPVCILVLFDLLLDPTAVTIGLWQYVHEGIYYSVPLQNFIGWALSGGIGSLFCYYVFNAKNKTMMYGLWYSFCCSILFWSVVAFGKGLYVPCICGVLLLVIVGMIHYTSYEKNSHD